MFDKASQATSISSGGLWGCRGGNEQIARGWIIASRESGLSAASKSSRRPRFERQRFHGATVAPPYTSMKAAAAVSPPASRSAGGGGMFGARGNIAYLSLPFCALMRRRRPREETRRRRGLCDAAAPQKRRDGAAGSKPQNPGAGGPGFK